MNKQKTFLRIDASARHEGSVTRLLGDELQARWLTEQPGAVVQHRDLSQPLPLLDAAWVAANLTDPAERNREQQAVLALSDTLISELQQADAILATVPLYNFAVPAAMKAWIDLVCRARETFTYTATGPQGLLKDRPVYLVTATGGVPTGSTADFASGYLKHIFGFLGLRDVRSVIADQVSIDSERAMADARRQLAALFDGRDEAA